MRLYVIEGGDGVGKSTIVDKLSKRFKTIVQPTSEGPLGFLRDIVKNQVDSLDLDNFSIQLLHTISHLTDNNVFGDIPICSKSIRIMDRSHISAMAYGYGNISIDKLKLINKIHYEYYKSKLEDIPVTIFLLDKEKPFEDIKTDVFEGRVSRDVIRNNYIKIFAEHRLGGVRFFNENENLIKLINHDSEVTYKIILEEIQRDDSKV